MSESKMTPAEVLAAFDATAVLVLAGKQPTPEHMHAIRAAVEALLARIAELERANYTLVDRGALQMAVNVLRRAGKNEVADALQESVKPIVDALAGAGHE